MAQFDAEVDEPLTDKPAQKLHQFLSSGLPRSGMAVSPKFSLHIWLAKLTVSGGYSLEE
jgi:hypothetical protein